jgi:hypothetical protein
VDDNGAAMIFVGFDRHSQVQTTKKRRSTKDSFEPISYGFLRVLRFFVVRIHLNSSDLAAEMGVKKTPGQTKIY